MPDFSTELSELETVQAQNITALVLDGKKQFNNISHIVETEASAVTDCEYKSTAWMQMLEQEFLIIMGFSLSGLVDIRFHMKSPL